MSSFAMRKRSFTPAICLLAYMSTSIPSGPSVAGEYQVIPPVAKQLYFPEVYGRGDGMLFTFQSKGAALLLDHFHDARECSSTKTPQGPPLSLARRSTSSPSKFNTGW